MIRPALPSDLNHVKKTWFDSFADSSIASSLSEKVFSRRWSALIDELAARCTILVEADETDPDVVIGWVAFEGPVLHYIFVRRHFRRTGLATRLLEAAGKPFLYSHRTQDWQRVTMHWGSRRSMTFDPTYAWRYFGAVLERDSKRTHSPEERGHRAA